MSNAREVQSSALESRSGDSEAEEELRKDREFSYTREFLLSLAELDTCKRLPNRFDSSTLCELNNASAGSSIQSFADSDTGRCDCRLSQNLQPDNGVLGRVALLTEPTYMAEVSSQKVQSSSYHPSHTSELNSASTGLSPPSSDSDSGRWYKSLSRHPQQNPECGLLGKGALLGVPGCPVKVSTPIVQGSSSHLLNRSVTPYRPPHLCKMNLHSRTESKDPSAGTKFDFPKCSSLARQEEERRQRDSLELRKEHKNSEQKQRKVSDEHKENLDDPLTPPARSRNNKGSLGTCFKLKEGVVSLVPSFMQASASGRKFSLTSSSGSVEKGFRTKSLCHSPVQEHYDIEAVSDQTENSTLSSSMEEENKPAGGVSIGNENHESRVHIVPNGSVDNNGVPQQPIASTTHSPTEKFSGQLCDILITFPGDIKCEETEPSIVLKMNEDHLHPHQCIQSFVEEQSNSTSHSGSSQHLVAVSKKGMDAIELAAAAISKLNSSTTRNLRSDPAFGNETDKSEVQIETDKQVNNCDSKRFSSGTNVSEVYVSSIKISTELEYTSFCSQGTGIAQKLMVPPIITPSTSKKVSTQSCSVSTSVVPPGVLMCKKTGQSSVLDITGNHFSPYQCVENYDIEERQTNTASHFGSTGHLFDLLRKSKGSADLAGASSKLNSSRTMTTGNLEIVENYCSQYEANDIQHNKSYIGSHFDSSQHLLDLLKKGKDATDLEAACSSLNSYGAMTTGNFEQNLISEHEPGYSKELHLITSANITEYDFLWRMDFPSPLDSKTTRLPINELIRVNHATATSLSCDKQTDLKDSRGNDLLSSEVANKIELDSPSERVLELNPVGGFDEKVNASNEICLPDEDSLITLDDLLLEMDSMLTVDGNSTDANMVGPAVIGQKSEAFSFSGGNGTSPSGTGSTTLLSKDMLDARMPYENRGARQSYPCSYANPRKPSLDHSEFRFSATRIYSHGPVRRSVMLSFPQQMIIPEGLSHRFDRLGGGARPDEMVCYSPWLNQSCTQHYEQPIHGVSNPGHNNLSGIEEAKQPHPW